MDSCEIQEGGEVHRCHRMLDSLMGEGAVPSYAKTEPPAAHVIPKAFVVDALAIVEVASAMKDRDVDEDAKD